MKKHPLDNADYDLIKAAHAAFGQSLAKDWHGVAAAIRLQSGEIVTSLVLEAENPSLTICAEPIAIGKALEKIANDPVTGIVAVRKREPSEHKVIPPCGRCREFITDYCPDALVIVDDSENKTLTKGPGIRSFAF